MGINFCLIVQALETRDMTRSELLAQTGVVASSLDPHMRLLHQTGLAYRKKLRTDRELREDGTYKSGPSPVLWAWNPKPFMNRDFQEQS